METQTQQQPIIVKSGGSAATPIALGIIGVLGFFGIKKYLKQQKENSAEAESGTPEGQIALQLKTVFDKFPVSDSEYKLAASQITATNKSKVYELYRNLTQRNLSDDIASHISSGAQATAIKTEQYNSKPGKLFSISADNNIKFEVSKGSFVRFAPGQTTPIISYVNPYGIILHELKDEALITKLKKDPKTALLTVSVPLNPSAKVYTVVDTKEVPLEYYKSLPIFSTLSFFTRPVNIKKRFAAVQILLGYQKVTNKPVLVWIDARDMVTYIPKKTVHGINLGLVG